MDPSPRRTQNDPRDLKDQRHLEQEVHGHVEPINDSVGVTGTVAEGKKQRDGDQSMECDQARKYRKLAPSITSEQDKEQGGVTDKARRPKNIVQHC